MIPGSPEDAAVEHVGAEVVVEEVEVVEAAHDNRLAQAKPFMDRAVQGNGRSRGRREVEVAVAMSNISVLARRRRRWQQEGGGSSVGRGRTQIRHTMTSGACRSAMSSTVRMHLTIALAFFCCSAGLSDGSTV